MNRKISHVQNYGFSIQGLSFRVTFLLLILFVSYSFSSRPTQKYTDVFFSSNNLSVCVCVRLWLIILNQMI